LEDLISMMLSSQVEVLTLTTVAAREEAGWERVVVMRATTDMMFVVMRMICGCYYYGGIWVAGDDHDDV
jgi:hypothetical protein